jgi:hypothetical protein
MPRRNMLDPTRMILEPTGIKPRRGRECIRQLGELVPGVAGIDAIDDTDRGEVAIGEIIGAPRSEAAPKCRERGGARAGTQNQYVMVQGDQQKGPRQAEISCRGEPVSAIQRAKRSCRDTLRPRTSGDHSFSIFSAVIISLSSFFSTVPVTLTLIGSSLEAWQKPSFECAFLAIALATR